MRRLAVLVCVGSACGGDPVTADASHADAPPAARCDPSAPFKTPVLVAELASAREDLGARLTADELAVVFCRTNADATWDLYAATRATTSDPFGSPQVVGAVNTIYNDLWPTLTPDGLGLYFDTDRIAPGTNRIWHASRASSTGPWGTPAVVTELQNRDEHPYLANASSLYFSSPARMGAGQSDIFHAEVSATGAVTTIAAVLGGVNTPVAEVVPVVTADDLHIYFGHNDGTNGYDIYTASRSSTSDGFGAASPVPGMSAPAIDEVPSWVSPDGCHLYLATNQGVTGADLYLATRE